MEITHIPAGSRTSDDIDEILAEGQEESWDVARVRALDSDRAEHGGQVGTALALEGTEAAGFTEVAHFGQRPEVGWQGSTLVAREHRGHGLGAALKIANHLAVGIIRRWSGSTRGMRWRIRGCWRSTTAPDSPHRHGSVCGRRFLHDLTD